MIKDIGQGIALALMAFFLGGLIFPKGIPWNREIAGAPVFETVDIEAVRAASKTGTPVLLDARNPTSSAIGHIEKAINVPHNVQEEIIREVVKQPEIIAYCSEPSCPDSKDLAMRLWKAGAKSVKLYPGGWEEWSLAEGLR